MSGATSYTWSYSGGGTPTGTTTTSTFTPTSNGTLTVTATNSCGTSLAASLPITVTTTPVLNPVSAVTSCDSYLLPGIAGSNLTGSEAYYTGTGGTGTQYLAGASVSTSQTLYVYDANVSCSAELSLPITVNPTPTLTPVSAITSCDSYLLPGIAGSNLTGSEAYYTGTGGTGTQYLAGASVSSSQTLYVYDINGSCSAELSLPITVNTTPVLTPVSAITLCDSYGLPVITGSNLTGSEAYYTGTNGTGTQYLSGTSISTSQTLYVYDANGSCYAELSLPITVNPTPVLDPVSTVTLCDSYSLPAIGGSNLTGSEAYYTGTNGTGTQYLAGASVSTSQTLYLYDVIGSCSAEQSLSIIVNPTPVLDPVSAITLCDSYGLPVITGSNLTGSEAYYTGTNGTGTQYLSGTSISTSQTLYVYDANGSCYAELSFAVTISGATSSTQVIAGCSPYTSPSGTQIWTTTGVYFDTVPNNSGCDSLMTINFNVIDDDATFNISPTSYGGYVISEALPGGTYSFNITPGDDAVINPVTGTITEGTAGESYEVLYTTNGTCPSSSIETVTAYDLLFPTGFSPNGDGFNDVFVIENLDQYPNNEIEIYNRWGELIYQASPYLNDWNGQNISKGVKLRGKQAGQDTYFYILKLDKDVIPIKNHLELRID